MAKSLWVRIYTETTRDRKLRRLDPACRWVWIALLCMAKESPVVGALFLSKDLPVTIDDIADEAGVDLDVAKEALDQFVRHSMVEIDGDIFVIKNWAEWQYESDSSTERVRKSRAKRFSKSETFQQRFCNDDVTPPETETETETDNKPKDLCTEVHEGAAPEGKSLDADKGSPVDFAMAKETKRAKEARNLELFNLFWDVYPKKQDKGRALNAFKKLKPDEALTEEIIAGVRRAMLTESWQKPGLQFVPLPSSYLNGQRWKDKLIIPGGGGMPRERPVGAPMVKPAFAEYEFEEG